MNDTLRKYELMKELGIDTDLTHSKGVWWHDNIASSMTPRIAAAILERVCREWLEQHGVKVNDGYQTFGFMLPDKEVLGHYGYKSYDAAQIAALEYCLKERK